MSAGNLPATLDVRAGRGVGSRLDRLSEGRFAAIVAAPGLLLVAVLIVPPVLAAIGLSFFRIELGRDGYTPFVGLRNYVVRLPADAEFLGTLPVTLGFAAATTAISVPLALLAASLINGRRRLRGVLGLLLILPWAVAPIADGVFWRLVFSNDTQTAIGLPAVRYGQLGGALIAMLVAVTWRAIPLLGVLFLGALRQVPGDLQRAARLDGATSFQAFRHVTLPAIAPSVIAACLLQIILTLQVFDVQFALSGDQPAKGSMLTGMAVFKTVIEQIALGYGATQTMVLAVFIGICLYALWVLVIRPATGRLVPAKDAEDLVATRRTPRTAPESNGLRVASATARRGWEAAAAPVGRSPAWLRSIWWLGSGWLRRLVGTAALVLLALWLVGPILWMVVASTQTEAALQAVPPRLSTNLHFEAYTFLLGSQEWREAAVVSVTVTVGATLLALAVATLTAYPLARYRMRGSRSLLLFLLGSQLIPPIALAIPILFIFIRLDLRNTVLGLIVINAAFWAPILVWLLRGAFLAVPRNLELAARIDGSSRLGTIFRVTLPVAAPAIAAAAGIVFVGIWNDFVFAAVIGGRDTHTLPRYLGESFSPGYHILAARIVLTVAPCIALVALLRRRILGLL